MFNKKAIAEKFSRSANTYNDIASLQHRCAKELCKIAQSHIQWHQHPKILDLGSGTGFIANNLPSTNCHLFEVDLSLEMLNHAKSAEHIFKIQSDIEALPFLDQQFDAILSSFSLQWLNDLTTSFKRFESLLKPGGILAICIPIEPSLSELKAANIFRFNVLPTFDHIKQALGKTELEVVSHHHSQNTQTFTSGIAAIKSIKKLGANHTQDSFKRINKKQIEEFNSFCLKNFSNTDKNIAISWNICHIIYRRKKTSK